MNRNEFRNFCISHNLSIEEAGRNWHDAQINGGYVCTVIRSDEDFNTVKPLLENNDGYLVSAKRKNGQAWFEYGFGDGHIYADDIKSIAREMANQYAEFLFSRGDISYYSADDIARRDKELAAYPALEDETEDEHFKRVEEAQDDGWLAPRYVNEAGYWDCNSCDLMLSDVEINNGVWSYSYDDWTQNVILISNGIEENKEE